MKTLSKKDFIKNIGKLENEINRIKECRKKLVDQYIKCNIHLHIGQIFPHRNLGGPFGGGSYIKTMTIEKIDGEDKLYIIYGMVLKDGTKIENSYNGSEILDI